MAPHFPTKNTGTILFGAFVLLVLSACREATNEASLEDANAWTLESPAHVGRTMCTECHGEEVAKWTGSHHDLAMQPATPATVLGEFDSTFTHGGVTTTFFREGEEYRVRTDGVDGELQDFRVVYTFGVTPLQQYLVELDGGRLQALSICWDSRSAEQGGQRWFHLYPEETIDYRDPLHWTGRYQNWNFMCAECHSTALDKGYDPGGDRYQTTWQEIDVSCEACHGPASNHLLWARSSDREAADADPSRGFLVALGDRDAGVWQFAPAGSGMAQAVVANASRSVARREHAELEACARCHSRRSPIHPRFEHGRPFLDSYRPVTLDAPLYHPDGQILDEVYVYGSFLQSRMFHEGVTCNDCHDPHSLALRGTTETVCAQCHAGKVYDSPDHHHHQVGSEGARCVECHMPATTYMQVDPRRDHSFRVPRPDLSLSLDTPNACTGCHGDQSSKWAAELVSEWFPEGHSGTAHYGEALFAARSTATDAEPRLTVAAEDQELPSLVRATALNELARYLSARSLQAVEAGLRDSDPQVRLSALTALDGADVATRVRLALPSLYDEVRAVRLEAARVSGPIPAEALSEDQSSRLDLGLEEYKASQWVNADRPEAHLNLGALAALRGDPATARRFFETALRLEPGFAAAAINLADLERLEGRDTEGARILEEALDRSPNDARLHHALGLAKVRSGLREEALDSLARARELDPQEPRYSYVYGVALHDLGGESEGLEILRANHELHPGDRETLAALVSYSRSAGDRSAALLYARRLQELAPDDQLRALVAELER